MRITIDECYELEGDYQNQFLGKEVFPKPKYKKLKLAERSVFKVHYDDIYILEPLHYYYVTFNEDLTPLWGVRIMKTEKSFCENGLLMELDYDKNRMYLFNASQNTVYIQKGATIGKLLYKK